MKLKFIKPKKENNKKYMNIEPEIASLKQV